jgi:6-phosphofructokinase 1
MADKLRIGINTGGGDAPGLNAVIHAVTMAACRRGWDVIGIRGGYAGLIDPEKTVRLDPDRVRGIVALGGTILGTNNKGDPFHKTMKDASGAQVQIDLTDQIVENFKKLGLDCFVAVGGDGSLTLAHQLSQKGIPVVGVPKTIDNDLNGTEATFGFDTAVATATEALDKLHSTAEAHERVMVVEVMGRNAGWIALHSGISGSADVILLPELPFDIEKICAHIMRNDRYGKRYAIVVAGEGARPAGGAILQRELPEAERKKDPLLGGVAEWVAREIAARTGKEARSLVLGHLQRGGSPTTFDRLIALRFGAAAVRFIAEGKRNVMVASRPPSMVAIPLEEAVSRIKVVPIDSDQVLTARDLGICFGDG